MAVKSFNLLLLSHQSHRGHTMVRLLPTIYSLVSYWSVLCMEKDSVYTERYNGLPSADDNLENYEVRAMVLCYTCCSVSAA